MDKGVSRKLITRKASLQGVLLKLQCNIYELLNHASVLLHDPAYRSLESPSENPLTYQSLSDAEQILIAVGKLLQYWEEEMQRTLGKARLIGRGEQSTRL
jgi:hypothetical protein